MKTRIYEYIRIFVVLALSIMILNSCTDDDLSQSGREGNRQITLTLPIDNIVNINTRAVNTTEDVANVLVCISNGSNPIKWEFLTDFIFQAIVFR